MQCAVIEFARNVLGLSDANSSEFTSEGCDHPVICMLEEQKTITYKGGTMRLGAQPCVLQEDSHAARAYGTTDIEERHRHRYEFNPAYKQQFIDAGMIPVGSSPNGLLAEVVEKVDVRRRRPTVVLAPHEIPVLVVTHGPLVGEQRAAAEAHQKRVVVAERVEFRHVDVAEVERSCLLCCGGRDECDGDEGGAKMHVEIDR